MSKTNKEIRSLPPLNPRRKCRLTKSWQVSWLTHHPSAHLPVVSQWFLEQLSAITVAGTAPVFPDSLLNRYRYQFFVQYYILYVFTLTTLTYCVVNVNSKIDIHIKKTSSCQICSWFLKINKDFSYVVFCVCEAHNFSFFLSLHRQLQFFLQVSHPDFQYRTHY